MDNWTDGWVDGWMDDQMDEMDGWIVGWVCSSCTISSLFPQMSEFPDQEILERNTETQHQTHWPVFRWRHLIGSWIVAVSVGVLLTANNRDLTTMA